MWAFRMRRKVNHYHHRRRHHLRRHYHPQFIIQKIQQQQQQHFQAGHAAKPYHENCFVVYIDLQVIIQTVAIQNV